MMTIPNPQQETLQQLHARIAPNHPGAKIRKVLWSPEAIFVPYGNFKFVVRNRKGNLKVDHTLPVLYTIAAIVISIALATLVLSLIYGQITPGVGGALFIVLGIVIMKYIFQRVRKTEFEQFRNELTSTANGFDFERNITAEQ